MRIRDPRDLLRRGAAAGDDAQSEADPGRDDGHRAEGGEGGDDQGDQEGDHEQRVPRGIR